VATKDELVQQEGLGHLSNTADNSEPYSKSQYLTGATINNFLLMLSFDSSPSDCCAILQVIAVEILVESLLFYLI